MFEGSSVDAVIWLQVEVKLGIFSACLPILPPLLRRVAKSVRLPSYISHMSSSIHSRFSKVGGSIPTGGHTAIASQASTAANTSVVNEVSPAGGAHTSRKKRETKEWHSVVMTDLSTNGRDEDSQSAETLVHEKRSPSVSV